MHSFNIQLKCILCSILVELFNGNLFLLYSSNSPKRDVNVFLISLLSSQLNFLHFRILIELRLLKFSSLQSSNSRIDSFWHDAFLNSQIHHMFYDIFIDLTAFALLFILIRKVFTINTLDILG